MDNENNTVVETKKKSKTLVVVILIIAVLLIGTGVGTYIYFTNKPEEKIPEPQEEQETYSFVYYYDFIPGAKYEVSVKGNQVIIKETSFCSALDCEPRTNTEKYTYSKENADNLKKIIKENLTGKDEYHRGSLDPKIDEIIVYGLVLGENFFEIAYEPYEYKLDYEISDNLSYILYFKENDQVLVKKLTINDDYDITNIDTYELKFTKENKNILLNYVKGELKDDDTTLYKYQTLKKNEVNLFKSISENDESYLKDYENDPKLLYKITYHGINCETPVLYLYDDNTYEFYYTFSTDGKALIPKTGTYDYDMNNLINNIDKYEEDHAGPFSITDSTGKTYTTYSSNIELKELTNTLGINLSTCLEEEK